MKISVKLHKSLAGAESCGRRDGGGVWFGAVTDVIGAISIFSTVSAA